MKLRRQRGTTSDENRHWLRLTSPAKEEEGWLRSSFFGLLKLALALTVLILIGWGIWLLSQDVLRNGEYFALKKVTYKTNGLVDEATAMQVMECASNEYLLGFSTGKAEKKLLALPDVVTAQVQRVLPDALVIELAEHQVIGKVLSDDGELLGLVSRQGVVVEQTPRHVNLLRALPAIVESSFLSCDAKSRSVEFEQALRLLVEMDARQLKVGAKTLTMTNDYSYELTGVHRKLEFKAVFPFRGHKQAVENFVEVMELTHRQLNLKEIILLGEDQTVISVY